MADNKCIVCSKEVRPRQHAVLCDSCDRWHHKTCNTGISLQEYRDAVRSAEDLVFVCMRCSERIPVFEAEDDVEDVHTNRVDEVVEVQIDEMSVAQSDQMSVGHTDDMDEEQTRYTSDGGADTTVKIDIPFTEPREILERSLNGPAPRVDPVLDRPLTFEVVKGASQRGGDLLFDSSGYSYTVKERRNLTTKWTCSVRNKKMKCPAGVIEKNGEFRLNSTEHVHSADLARCMTAKIYKKTKELSAINNSAKGIVSDARSTIQESETPDIPGNEEYLARRTNRHRKPHRPEELKALDFVLDNRAMPDEFLRDDILVDGRRQLVLAANAQLEHLGRASKWYFLGKYT